MTNEELLLELSHKVQTQELSKEEVLSRLNISAPVQQAPIEAVKKHSNFSFTKMLYFIGAAIVIVGIVIFVGQIWEDIDSLARIIITLGLGLLMAAMGSMLLKQKPDNNIGAIFHTIGGVLIPFGAMVTLIELSSDIDDLWPVTITYALIFMFYLLLNIIHKHAILTFFAIANGTAVVYLLVASMLQDSYGYDYEGDIYAYVTMIIGLSYLLLGYAFRGNWNKHLVGVLYFFGSAGFLAAGFSQVLDDPMWELIYFVLVAVALFVSVYLKSRSILIVSTLALIGHITYITGQYFADSIGWPICLVILGFIFIGLGYASVTINKKYIKGV